VVSISSRTGAVGGQGSTSDTLNFQFSENEASKAHAANEERDSSTFNACYSNSLLYISTCFNTMCVLSGRRSKGTVQECTNSRFYSCFIR